ncbi:condensation domain-containing protein [Arsenicicoccus sp. oral taxon 190]|uniref:condensation domain-containing protein n=1 Tax=Arsenicicoccus sp. oral taxon 190 TaxID=1658671 RepID=UPI00067A344E|nr:condensation domain-containing protein [Arsenicicoccus sp. oral taxon 190]AKT50538.1 hypothetical protein ADJ73_03015 [Arsenicicoccus sp. oral taxon 190]
MPRTTDHPPPSRLPLLPPQRGMLSGHLVDPTCSAWHVALVSELAGPVDVDALADAVRRTTDEMDALRVRFDTTTEPPTQHVAPTSAGAVEIRHLTGTADRTPDEVAARALALVRDVSESPWDLTTDSPVLSHTLVVAPGRVWWLQRGLHAAVDGFGGWIVRHRVIEHYLHTVNGTPLDDAPFPTLADLVAATGTVGSPEGQAFWRDYLHGAPERLSPADANRPVADHPHRHDVVIPVEVRDDLALVLGNRVWTYPLIAAAGAFVARVSEQHESVIGTPVTGRASALARRVPVQMMTVVPLRIRVDADDRLVDVTRRAVDDARATRPHQGVQAEEIFEAVPSAWRAGRFHGPVVNVMPYDADPVIPGVSLATDALQRGPIYDLLLTVRPLDDGSLAVEVQSHRELYTADETRCWAERFAAYMARVSRPGVVVAEQDTRHAAEIETAARLATPRVPARSADLPPWGAVVDVDGLAVPGLDGGTPRGYVVLDRLGHPVGWHQVGELVAVTEAGRHPTGWLVSQDPDGTLVSRGALDERREVHGRYVEAGAVAATMAAVPGVQDATAAWEGRRLVARITVAPGADEDLVGEQVHRAAPAGCRLRTTFTPGPG